MVSAILLFPLIPRTVTMTLFKNDCPRRHSSYQWFLLSNFSWVSSIRNLVNATTPPHPTDPDRSPPAFRPEHDRAHDAGVKAKPLTGWPPASLDPDAAHAHVHPRQKDQKNSASPPKSRLDRPRTLHG